uniref:hypothetical protein n=1 Tax=Enterocloster clostridioformis TaxID=1531 RepID=UPI002675C393|nr:hypothetical protein [Enterocloster clostridioformis]
MIRRTKLLSVLNAPGGDDYFDFDYNLVCESLKKLYELMKQGDGAITSDYRAISERQYNETQVVLRSLEVGDIRNAYHSLWDIIDDMGRGQDKYSYISKTEHILLYSLVQSFVMYIDYQNNLKVSEESEKEVNMEFLNDRYAKVYSHKGYDICTLKRSCPAKGDGLGYVIDDAHYTGQEFNLVEDAIKAIDMQSKGL